MESVMVHASQPQSTVLSEVAVYTVFFVSRLMSECRKKVLRAPTCAVAFLILDLTSVSSRRSGVIRLLRQRKESMKEMKPCRKGNQTFHNQLSSLCQVQEMNHAFHAFEMLSNMPLLSLVIWFLVQQWHVHFDLIIFQVTFHLDSAEDGYNPIYYPLGDLDKPTHRDIHQN